MKKDLIVVGIGSSAGGLEALQILFSTIKELDNVAYIVAQHLSPTHKSMMVELLGRVSNINVQEAKSGLIIKPKTIYITPENTDIYVKDKKIFLKSINHIFGPKPSVNYLLSSIAQDFEQNCVAIILSGTGSDGAYGIRAIKAEGGITIAQSPASAKYDGMPFSAINTGKVDLVISIDEMANEIEKVVNSLGKDIKDEINQNFMQQIFKILFDETGVDFSLYKKNTITRRLVRRMQALKMENLNEYVSILKANNEEISNLYGDILIGVTSFFRDVKVFDEIIPQIETICTKKEQGEEIRVWSVGCSTGEEAYSLAIVISEVLKDKVDKYKIKIFATDIDDESLKIARIGIYSETSLLNMKKEYIHKYFNVLKNQYEIKKNIREMVIFSKHNIVSDSPFLRMDMISCRNMLIYFSSSLQRRVFPIFHYSLKENGILLLGKSETVAEFSDLFYTIDKNSKIYKSQYTGLREAPKLYNYSGFKTMQSQNSFTQKSKRSDEEVFENNIVTSLYEYILANCIVINSSNEVIYNKCELPILKFSKGKVTHNLFKLVDENLVLDLRTAINEVNKTNKYQKIRFREVKIVDDVFKLVRAIIIPIVSEKDGEDFKVIFFETEDKNLLGLDVIPENGDDIAILKLKEELETNKAHLQNVIEELETSYEEMQSLNEELQSSNEELQSSNEELETTNEELQSTNEELQTAYSELKILYEDKDKRAKLLEELTNKLKNKTDDYRKEKEISEAIVNTVPVSILFVDDNCIITYINDNAQKLFNINSLLNKSFDNSNWSFYDVNYEKIKDEELPFSIIKKTFEKVEDYSMIININDKELYLNLSGAPLFDSEGKFKGAVFSVEDITQGIEDNKKLENYKEKLLENDKKDNDFITNFKNYQAYNFIQKENSSNDMMKYLYLEFNMDYRNKLNELNLLVNQIKNNKNSDSVLQMEEIFEQMADSLNSFENYFEERDFKKVKFIMTLKRSLILFDSVLKAKDINVQNKTTLNNSFFFEDRNSKQLIVILFEFFIYLSETLFNELDIIISSTNESLTFNISSKKFDYEKINKDFSEKNPIYDALSESGIRLGLNIQIRVNEDNIEIELTHDKL